MRLIVMAAMAALGVGVGCSSGVADADRAPASRTEAFVGAWRSVTPSFEFIRLSLYSASVRQGAIAARVLLSGAELDAIGQIDADSVVGPMTLVGSETSTGTIRMRATNEGTLAVQLRPSIGPPQELLFVRE